jgi:hypothetical protein
MTIQQQLLDDLDAVFDAGLTIEITHTYNGGGSNETLKVFFDNPYQPGLSRDEVESQNPSILVQTADAGNIDRNSEFTILSTTYYVVENQSDNEGVTRIIISQDAIS